MLLPGRLSSPYGRAVLARVPGLMLGLVLFGAGIALKLRSGLGLSPWDAFHQGVSIHVPLSIGTVTILVSGLVLFAWIPLRQRVGVGTVLNAVTVGSPSTSRSGSSAKPDPPWSAGSTCRGRLGL